MRKIRRISPLQFFLPLFSNLSISFFLIPYSFLLFVVADFYTLASFGPVPKSKTHSPTRGQLTILDTSLKYTCFSFYMHAKIRTFISLRRGEQHALLRHDRVQLVVFVIYIQHISANFTLCTADVYVASLGFDKYSETRASSVLESRVE